MRVDEHGVLDCSAHVSIVEAATTPRPRTVHIGRALGTIWRPFSVAVMLTLAGFGLWSSIPRGTAIYDFGTFVDSGRAAAEGRNPYLPGELAPSGTHHGERVALVNLNPPISVLAFELLARADPYVAFRIWHLASLVLFGCTLALLVRANRARATPLRIAWCLGLAGLWNAVRSGQVYVPLLVVCAGAWLALRARRTPVAGLLLGLLVAVKPNFALWPLLLLIGGEPLVAGIALGTAALLSAVPLVAYGPEIYLQWLRAIGAITWVAAATNASLPGLAARLGLPALAIPVSAVAVAGTLAWALRRKRTVAALGAVGLIVSVLAAPAGWSAYFLLLLPAVTERPAPLAVRLGGALLVIPEPLVSELAEAPAWAPLRVLLGSLYVIAACCMLWGLPGRWVAPGVALTPSRPLAEA